MAGDTGYPRLTAAGDSANDAFLDAITAAVDSFDAYVAKVNASATILAGDNTTFKMQGVNGPAVSGATRTVKLLGRPDSEHQVFLTVLNAISDTFAAYRTKVNANAAITGGDTTCYKVQALNGPAVSGATVFYRSDSRFDTDLDDTETQINGLVDALSAFASGWNLKQGGTPTTLVVSTVRRLRPMQRSSTGGGGGGGGVSDPPTRNIAVDGGDSQSATVATQPTTPLTVEVTDASNALVEGDAVTWTITGDGSITSSSQTNSSGIASATPTLGTLAGTYTVMATSSTGATVTFTLTATAGAATQIRAISATSQSGLTSGVVSAPPSVLVSDAYDNPKSGVTVTFAVTGGGGSRTPATVDSAATTGLATLTSWTLGASAGLNTLTATAAGLTGSPVTFTANAAASAPTQIAVQSGGGQTGITAGQAATATVVRVRDGSNNPVQGVTVTATVTTGNGSLNQSSGVSNASGDVSFTYTTDELVETATLTFEFTNASGALVGTTTTIASTFGTAAQLGLQTQPSSNGSSGTALSQQPIVLIQDANGNTVTNSTLTVTATVQSGNAILTAGSTKAAVAGVATFTGMTLTDADAGANVLRFSSGGLTTVDSNAVTLSPPIPVALQFTGPISNVTEDTSSLTCGVFVVDNTNTVVPGATDAVTVALTTPGGAVLSGTLTVNAVAGTATFTGLAVDTPGTYTLTATSGTLTSAVSGSFTVNAASGAHPNEPAGYTRFSEWDCSALPPTTRANFGIDGAWYCERGTNQSILPSNKYQIRFPGSLTAGTDPGNLRTSHDTGINDPTNAFYLHIAGFRPGRSVADGGDDGYQNHAVDTKICHFKCFALGGGTGAAILRLLGQSPGNVVMQTFKIDVLSKQANLSYAQNVNPARLITAGQDNDIEVQCVMNSGAGVADGILKIWANGTLVTSHSNVVYKTATSGTVGFYDWWFEHTYGGTASGAPPSGTRTRTDFWEFDHIYLSQP